MKPDVNSEGETVTVWRSTEMPDSHPEMLEVPKRFESSDVAAYYGAAPDGLEIKRVYLHDGVVRAEGELNGTVIEIGYFAESPPGRTDTGWIADEIDGLVADDAFDQSPPGLVLWERE